MLFNPPFLLGAPKDHRDAAWRSVDGARRFAVGLGEHLAPGGAAFVLLSSFGDACALFETELRANGFRLGGLRAAPVRQRDVDDRARDAGAARMTPPERGGECC